jgi:rod shape determining protein RodA
MIFFHLLINIGMTIGLAPVTGIPLPFISYGGSSLLTNMIAIGLVLNVGMRRQKINF